MAKVDKLTEEEREHVRSMDALVKKALSRMVPRDEAIFIKCALEGLTPYAISRLRDWPHAGARMSYARVQNRYNKALLVYRNTVNPPPPYVPPPLTKEEEAEGPPFIQYLLSLMGKELTPEEAEEMWQGCTVKNKLKLLRMYTLPDGYERPQREE